MGWLVAANLLRHEKKPAPVWDGPLLRDLGKLDVDDHVEEGVVALALPGPDGALCGRQRPAWVRSLMLRSEHDGGRVRTHP